MPLNGPAFAFAPLTTGSDPPSAQITVRICLNPTPNLHHPFKTSDLTASRMLCLPRTCLAHPRTSGAKEAPPPATDLFALRPGERFGSWWKEVDAEVGDESDSDGEGPRVDRDPTDNHHAAEEDSAPPLMLVERETADELVKVAGARAAAKKRLAGGRKKKDRRGPRGGR